MKFLTTFFILFVAVSHQLPAQFLLTSKTYTQDFNSLPSSGSSNSISTLPMGWSFNETGTGADLFYDADTISQYPAVGNTYSLGKKDSADRTLGTAASPTLTSSFGFTFINANTKSIKAITITFTAEEWFNGRYNRTDSLHFYYQKGHSFNVNNSWVQLPQFDFLTGKTYGVPFGNIDGNLPAHKQTFSITLYDLNIPVNDTFSVKWRDVDSPNTPDDAIGVDDFSISVIIDDIFPPVITSLTPLNGARLNNSIQNFSLLFSEPVIKGTGSIKILQKPAGIIFKTIDANELLQAGASNEFSFMVENLSREKDYQIIADSTLITDTAGNVFTGITNNQWKFSVLSSIDTLAPLLDTLFPTPGTSSYTNYVTCRMYFKEKIRKGYGNIYLKSYSNDAVVQTFNVDSPSVVVQDMQLYFKPSQLNLGSYYVTFDEGAIKDSANNNLPVFGKLKWTFNLTSVFGIPPTNSPLTINTVTPANGSTNLDLVTLEIYWYEYVSKQYGFINIRRVDNDSIVQKIDVLSPNVNTTQNYTSITVDPLPGGSYYIDVMAGTFRNINGVEFAGTAKAFWNLSTHNYITISDGVWGNPDIWLNKKLPPYGAAVTVKHNVLLTHSVTCSSLIIANPGSLTLNNEYSHINILH